METKKLLEAGTSARWIFYYRPNPACQPPSNPLREIFHKVAGTLMLATCSSLAITAMPDRDGLVCPVNAPNRKQLAPRNVRFRTRAVTTSLTIIVSLWYFLLCDRVNGR